MQPPRIVEATADHFDAILALERTLGGASTVLLTSGGALGEIAARGHESYVALDDAGAVIGWAWASLELARSGEYVAHLHRVAVAAPWMRRGIGRALAEHTVDALRARGAVLVRTTVQGDDERARAFLAALGYAVDAVTMEREL